MTSTDQSSESTSPMQRALGVDMKLEVVTLPVSDVDRAKSFYQSLGWRLDADFAFGDDIRAVQLTPPHSGARSHSGRASPQPSPAPLSVWSWSFPTSTQRASTSLAAASRSVMCSTATEGVFFRARTRNVAPISPMPLSAIRTATAGSSRR
jgi:catechol 2,3-dioxygenase-like lactoylglutathione lyase family enzyme